MKISQQTGLNKYPSLSLYICIPLQPSLQHCLLLQNSLKYSLKNNENYSKESLISMYHDKWIALSEPPTASHWRVDIPVFLKYRQGLQGHHLPISQINRIQSEAGTTITLNGKVSEHMWNSWKELENIKIHSNNLPIRNNRKKRNGKYQSGSNRYKRLKENISHSLSVVLEREENR